MKTKSWLILGLAGSALLFTGCGKKESDEAGHDHSEHAEGGEGEETGVNFSEARGLQLAPEVIKALGVTTGKAEERPLTAELTITAQVFATKPQVLASASLPADRAAALRNASFEGASLLRIDPALTTATRLADVVLVLEPEPARQVGDFVRIALKGKSASAVTVPRSAILDSAGGTFVYVVNNDSYRRTSVKLGAQAADFVEITDGIHPGDVVVTAPVDQLWLAELRLTKGGGHSH